jgi:hypothetical protein
MSDNQPPQISITRSPDYRRIYLDFIRSRIGNGDITVVICKTTHDPNALVPNVNGVYEEIEVTMSWTQLKLVHAIFGNFVEAIEHETGPILIPESFRLDQEAQRPVVRTLGLSPRSA